MIVVLGRNVGCLVNVGGVGYKTLSFLINSVGLGVPTYNVVEVLCIKLVMYLIDELAEVAEMLSVLDLSGDEYKTEFRSIVEGLANSRE